MRLAGQGLTGLKPYAVARAGVARTFQNIRLFANMTVIENVMVGRHRGPSGVIGAVLRDRRTRTEEAAIRRHAQRLLEYVDSPAGASASPGTCLTGISAGSRSPARWPPSRACSPSTSPRPA